MTHLAGVRRNGVAADLDEFIDGVFSISGGVRDHSGRFVAALGVTGNEQEIDVTALTPILKDVCARASRALIRAQEADSAG